MTQLMIETTNLRLSRQYAQIAHSTHFTNNPSRKERSMVIILTARTFDEEEVVAAVDSSLDFWLTLGSKVNPLVGIPRFSRCQEINLVNSGSSANLLALTAQRHMN